MTGLAPRRRRPPGRDAAGDPVRPRHGRDPGQQVEGSWYATDLFREVLERIERHLRPGEGEHYAREEVYYPAVAARLSDGPFARRSSTGMPGSRGRSAPATVWGLLDEPSPTPIASVDFDHVYAVKKVERVLHDRSRELIRASGAHVGRRLRAAVRVAAVRRPDVRRRRAGRRRACFRAWTGHLRPGATR